MDNTEHIDSIQLAMFQRRDLVKGVLGERYQERVAVYIKLVRNTMADKGINEVAAGLEMLSVAEGRIAPVDCALIAAAAVEIIEGDTAVAKNEDSTDQPHLSSQFYKGGLAPAVLVDGCEQREGIDHG